MGPWSNARSHLRRGNPSQRCSGRRPGGNAMNLRRLLFLAVTLPVAAVAQQEARTGAQPASHLTFPELNGHVFAPSLLVDSPFRETTFQLGLLYGFGSATGPRYVVSGGQVVKSGNADYTFADLAQTISFEYRFDE